MTKDARRKRLYLSPPHMSDEGCEMEFIRDAFASNWIAPVGPQVDAFEREFAAYHDMPYATAVSSGTAAIHLMLRILGVGDGDEVFCSSFTFFASATPIVYERATPVFLDSDSESWNMDPSLLEEELARCARRGRLPKAVIVVDLYGQSARYEPLAAACEKYGVPLIEDAAEALGATYQGKHTGQFGIAAAFSFNGNKIITTSGGGLLLSRNKELIDKARFLAMQARDPAPHYQHSQIGFNYRMSNIVAAIGRGQLKVLDERIAKRRTNFEYYRSHLADLPGISFMPELPDGRSTRWLTCIVVDQKQFGATREEIRLTLESANIESRPLWKPMHLQPVFAGCRSVGGAVSAHLFEYGLCLPSGSAMTDDDLAQVCEIVRNCKNV